MTFQLIKSSQIKYWCDKFSCQRDIAVDTEFSRTTTYWPILALIQLSDGHDTILIDPLEKGTDLSPVDELLANPDITKIFHSCRQDLEVFYKAFGRLPINIFDTQLAHRFLSPADEVSLARLLEEYSGIVLNKSKQNSNWMRRPLPSAQLDYAAKDVLYLPAVKHKLEKELLQKNRLAWLYEEQNALYVPETFEPISDYWMRLAKRANLRPKQLHYLKGLCDWREKVAMQLDYNRRRVLSDETILKIAESTELMITSDDLPDHLTASLFQLWEDLHQVPPSNWPKRIKNIPMNLKQQERLEDLKRHLGEIAQELNISEKFIASTSDLKNYVRGEQSSLVSTGWRKKVFYDRLQID